MTNDGYHGWTAVEVSDSRLLLISRLMAVPTALAGAVVAWRWPEPGMLLVVAFDIVFAGCVVPLFLGVYWRRASSSAAIAAIVAGTASRVAGHFLVPSMWAGLDTLLPPVVSLLTFAGVAFWGARDRATSEAPAEAVG